MPVLCLGARGDDPGPPLITVPADLDAIKRSFRKFIALIPEDGSYRIVPGPRVEGATELTEQYIDQYARYFLMPRRPDPGAEWIICYGCDPEGLERPARVVWDGGGGISILEATE